MPLQPSSPSSQSSGAMEFRTQKISFRDQYGQTVVIKAEIADTEALRERGLMFRKKLDADAGMLFVFEREQRMSFWMKNTLIPLYILFFDTEGNLVSTTVMQPCKKDPCPTYPSAGPAKYALEVSPAFTTRIWNEGKLDITTIR